MDPGPSDRTPVLASADLLPALAAEIEACRRCPLGSIRNRVVVYRGPTRPEVVFVGEAPGAEEDRTGVPFVGRAGRRLEQTLTKGGVDLRAVGFLNLIKCRPPENRFDRSAALACRPFLDRQLALLQPNVVVPLGAHALRAFAPRAPTITVASGRALAGPTGAVFPLLHPAAPLHNPRLRSRFDRDVRSLGEFLGARARKTVYRPDRSRRRASL